MRKKVFSLVLLLILAACSKPAREHLSDYVSTLVGTASGRYAVGTPLKDNSLEIARLRKGGTLRFR